MAKKKSGTYKGKSTRPGGGGAFAKMVDAMIAKGMSRSVAEAIAAKRGMQKYGKDKMMKFAAAGKKRAAKKRKK
jgi:hypothetical protein